MQDENKHRSFLMEQTFATLFSLTNKVQMNADNSFDLLTSRQLMAMIAVIHLPDGQATLQSLANKMGSSKQSTKHIVTSLEKKGYITIETHSNDRRAINIVITKEGKDALMTDGLRGYAFFNELFHDFSDEELDALWVALRKLYRYDGKEQDGFETEVQVLSRNQQVQNGMETCESSLSGGCEIE